jgi:acetylornithine deacetylase
VQVHGRAAHASAPEHGVNAIDQAGGLIAGLGALSGRLRQQQHDLLGYPTLTVCTIQGGFNDYTVPDVCSLTLNRRVLPLETERDVLAEVRAVLAERERIDPAFAADVQLCKFTPPMETDAQSPVVLALRSATEDVLGADPGVAGWSATCDASILTHGAGVPTVVFGPGSIARDAHRPDESVAVAELAQCARIFASTIVQLLADP